jgi:NAD(P)-dependent dehydrogenase (short-subunit alcohol dehydrogenase family)
MTMRTNVRVVTGAAGGIGKAVAGSLRAKDVTVVVADVDAAKAAVAAAELGEGGYDVRYVQVNVCDADGVARGFADVSTVHGGIDVLVNCAGLSIRGASDEYPLSSWDTVLDTNLKGTFLCCQAAGRQMIRQQSGRIVNIGSTAAAAGFPGRAAYCASKAGVVALTQVLAVEWAKHGIRVNCVSPAHTSTPLLDDAIARGFVNEADLLRRLPVGRLGHVNDVANAVAYLATAASDFLTGVNLYVDGGWTAQGII